jgi:hypothetical protein
MRNLLLQIWRTMAAPAGVDEPRLDLFVRRTAATMAACALLGGAWGFVRGVGYPPTVAFAVVEGAVIFAVPGLLLGLLVGLLAVLRHRPVRRS